MNRLQLAVIGAGHLGRIHARLANSLDNVDLVGVVDPNRQAAEQVAETCQTQALADHRALLGRIDAAIVAAPTPLHHTIGMELLQAGVHVLMEKPVTTTVEQADELIATAEARHLVLAVGHVERFNPALRAAAPLLKRPKYVEAIRATGYTFRSTDVGVVLDLMIHDLDAVLSLVGSPVVDVQALGIAVFGPHEDVAQTRLTFADGCVANITASRTSYQPHRALRAFCEQSFVQVDFADRTAQAVCPCEEILQRQINVNTLSAERKEHIKEHLFEELLPLEQIPVPEGNALLDEIADFVRCAGTGEAPRVTGRAGRDALAVAHRVLERIGAHRWNGAADGPLGPLATPPADIVRPEHWPAETELPQRKAG